MDEVSAYTIIKLGEKHKTVGKEHLIVFAIKNDFVDDFCNLFVFFRYNIYSTLFFRTDCKKNSNQSSVVYKQHRIVHYVYKYDSIKILKYLYNNGFIKQCYEWELSITIRKYSLRCIKLMMDEHYFSLEKVVRILLTTEKLSYGQKKQILKIFEDSKNKNKELLPINNNDHTICSALSSGQYELTIYLMQKYGFLMYHGNYHLKELRDKSSNKYNVNLYWQLLPYKDELYYCRSIMYLVLQAHKYDKNSTIFQDKFPRDIIKYVLKIFYDDRVEEIYRMKELQPEQ